VRNRFRSKDYVVVTKGVVPNVLHELAPERIAFLHVDLNSPRAEALAIEVLLDRVTPGGIVIITKKLWIDLWRAIRPPAAARTSSLAGDAAVTRKSINSICRRRRAADLPYLSVRRRKHAQGTRSWHRKSSTKFMTTERARDCIRADVALYCIAFAPGQLRGKAVVFKPRAVNSLRHPGAISRSVSR
jgi:hypothetical protein